MAGREVRDVNAVQGTIEGMPYNLWTMKEPDYIMKIMATSGSLIAGETCRSTIIIGLREALINKRSLLIHSNLTITSATIML